MWTGLICLGSYHTGSVKYRPDWFYPLWKCWFKSLAYLT